MKEGTKRTTINLDDATTAALDEIVERTGSTKTNALKQAIHAEARRLRRKDVDCLECWVPVTSRCVPSTMAER